ncbi:SdrD B-like domain-containing protein [Fibrella sp. WM1]|uniref:SdrD B-like domain-containing protein n=1 Tax=Fibrella musci TaxID=3242485 RepID=UPI0035223462
MANYSTSNVTTYTNITTTPTFSGSLVASGAGLNNPNSILLYRDTLYVANGAGGTAGAGFIRKYNPITGAQYGTGNFTSGLSFPERMVIGPDGNMYVADYNSNSIKRININNGVVLNTFTLVTLTGQNVLGIEFVGTDMYVTRGTISNAAGQLGRIERYTFSNNYTTLSLPTLITSYTGATPRGITLGPDGLIYVVVFVGNATAASYAARIERFAPGLVTVPTTFVNMDAGSNPYQGLNWSPDGFLYVADFGENIIQVYNSSGTEITSRNVSGLSGPHFVQFYCPCAATTVFTPSSLTACSGATSVVQITTTNANPQITYRYASSSPNTTISGPTTTTASSTSITINSTTTSTFSVTITDRIGCSAVAGGTLTVNALPTAALNSTAICAGQTATLTATGGSSYTLANTGAVNTTGTFSVTPAATTTYTVIVSNTSGCTATANGTVTVNALPTASVTPSTTAICAGQTATLTAGGGTSYRWSTGATTTSIPVTTAGTYSVTVTNASGCTATASGTVTVNALPTASVTPSTTAICAGQTATLTAGGGGTYLWSTGATTASIPVTTAGTYSVTVTNASGCTASASGTVTVNALPTASVTPSTTAICAGQTATLTAGGGTSYRWSTGATTTSIPVTTAGTYSVTVTNASGCTAVASGTVTVNALPTPTLSSTAICVGQTATLTATSGSSYTLVNTGAVNTTGTFSVTPAATTTYTVVVSNASGCTATANGTITVNDLPTASVTPSTTAICAGQTATLTAGGGTSYRWSTGATTTSIPVTTAGTYSVTVTNASGCTATASGTVTVNPVPVATAASTTATCANPATVSGTSSLTASTYSWTGPSGFVSSAQSFTTNTPGTYTLVVTANGCSSNAVTTTVVQDIVAPQNVAATNNGPITCAQPTATVSASSSTAGVTYRWSGPNSFTSSAQSFAIAVAGTYSVTVTSTANGCTAVTTTTVTSNTAPPAVTLSSATVCAGQTATLTATSGLTTYAFSAGLTQVGGSTGNTATIVGSGTGTTVYSVTATNAVGCTAVASGSVTVNPNPVGTATTSGTITCATAATVSGSSSLTGSSYSWTGPSGFVSSAQSFTTNTPGTYTLVVTANGCSSSAVTTTVTSNTVAPTATLSSTAICAGQTATLTAGSGVSYVLNPGNLSNNTGTFTVTPGGTTTYTVVVTGANGCTATANGTVTVNALPTASVTPSTTAICAGQTATLTAGGGTSYRWSTGATTASLPVTTAGTYSVTVTNASGCTAAASGTVTVNALPTASVTPSTTAICAGQTATLTAGGGGTYLWSTGATTASIPVTTAGTYSVTVTNASGCTASASGTVTVNALPAPTLSSTVICAGQTATLTASGGASYTLTPGNLSNTTGTFAVTPGSTTTYTVTASNASGCTATASGTVTVNPVPVATAASTTATCANPATVSGTSSLTASTYSWTGPSGFVSSAQSFTTNTPGTYTLVVTANGCSSSAVTTTVVQDIVAPQNVAATNTGPLNCTNLTATISVSSSTAGVTYRWSGPAGFTSTAQSFTTATSGLYSVTVTNPINGCTTITSTSLSQDITVPVVSATGGQIACQASTIQLAVTSTPSSGVSYRWTGPGSFTSAVQNPAVSIIGTYTVTVTNTTNGCAAADTAIVSKQACASLGDFVFEDTNANGIQDGGEPGIAGVLVQLYLNGNATPIATTTTNASGLYSFTGLTPGNGFSYVVGFGTPSGYIPTTANQNANANDALDSDADIATGRTGSYTLSAGENNLTVDAGFYRPASLGDRVFADANRNGIQDGDEVGIGGVTVQLYTATNTLIATTTTNASGLYSFTGLTPGVAYQVQFTTPTGYSATSADQGGNDALDSDANPATGRTGSYTLASNETNNTVDAGFYCIPPVVSATGGVLTCANPSVQLQATSNLAPSTYSWTGPGGFTSSVQNPSATLPGTYTVVVTSNAGCSATAVATATVTQDVSLPQNVTASNDGPLTCARPTATVSAATSTTGVTYRWSNGATTASFSTSIAGTYSVTVTSGNGCFVTASTTLIDNTAPPVATITASNTVVCAGEVVSLTASGGTSYRWSTAATTATISVTSTGTYSVTVTNANGCTAVVSQAITVNPLPQLTVNSATVCAGTSVSLTLSGCEGGTVRWSTGSASATLLVAPLTTTTYSVTCTLPTSCFSTTAATVTVTGAPTYTTNPTLTLATCTGNTPNNNARIDFTALQNTVRADIVLGSSYGAGPAFGAPSNKIVAGNTVSFTNLPNPTQPQDYTVRLFSNDGSCITDVVVTVAPADCPCQTKCVSPIVVRIVKP